MSKRAVVIGSGVNELVAARLLLRAGLSVTLFPEEGSLEETGWVPPPVAQLAGAGLKIEQPDPWAVAPLPGGGRLELYRDMDRSVKSIRGVSARDAEKWPAFCERMAALARLFEALYVEAPPDPLSLRFALRARRLGRRGLVDLMRILPMPVAELLDDWFESDALKGVLAGPGIRHLHQGPRSGGTAFRLIHHHVGCPPGVFRPPRSNVAELLSEGLEIQPGSVASIRVREGRAAGVFLEDGRELDAELVLSGIDPCRTLLELCDPAWLDPELARALLHVRSRPVAARMRLELDREPGFSTLVIAPSLDYLERAYDDVKYGRMSRQPYLEAHRDGGNRVHVDVQYVPPDTNLSELSERVCAMLSDHLGGAAVRHVQVDPPRQPHQAELSLDQALWMRPLPELAHYRTPIDGLWLCGPAMHPGGAIAGAAGYNCARAVLGSR